MIRNAFFIVCLLSLFSHTAIAAPSYVWTELVGDGQSVRVVTTDSACPALIVDGASVPTKRRLEANAAFANSVCEASLPLSARKVSLQERPIALLPKAVKRIVVIGDTGCRIKKNIIQACNNQADWPFATVAEHAARSHPDLIIHVGDYLYRETPCPDGDSVCAGSPHGDNWPTWDADFFTPAKPLLEVAPWVFVRGNHEQCGRSAEGWFRFLDAAFSPLNCPATAAPFVVPIDHLKLIVMDSADTDDLQAPPEKVALFKALFTKLDGQLEAGRGWILTHRPIWGFMPKGAGDKDEKDELAVNKTEEEAAKDIPLRGVDAILSGHIHVFANVSFGRQRPAQLIVGDGGDLREGDPGRMGFHNVEVDGLPAEAFVASRFGYFVLDRKGDPAAGLWDGTLHEASGAIIARCSLAPRQISCRTA